MIHKKSQQINPESRIPIEGRCKAHIKKCLSSSVLFQIGTTNINVFNNGITINDSYYNDRQKIYENKSRLLSEKSIGYQSKDISYSIRKKYNERKLENVVHRRSKTETMEQIGINRTMSVPKMQLVINKELVRKKIKYLHQRKYSQFCQKATEKKIKLLENDINYIHEETNTKKKLMNQIKYQELLKNKIKSNKLIIIPNIYALKSKQKQAQSQMHNIDKLFKAKYKKIDSLFSLPISRLCYKAIRPNLIVLAKKRDTINDVIQEYNKLIKMSRVRKKDNNNNSNKMGIRGLNLSKYKTISHTMGTIESQINCPQLQNQVQQQEIKQELFFKYCSFYQRHIKKDKHLVKRLIAGIKQSGKLDFTAFTKFYSIFVNKTASLNEKIKFLSYFFIPEEQEKAEVDTIKLILELMCEELPQQNSLNIELSQFFTKQQKSTTLALILKKLLFGGVKQFLGQTEDNLVVLNRISMEILLQSNEDLVSLLIRLLIME